ncbi:MULTISPECIES: hypothetical protein [Muribaculaceae]|uniref:hypothetical protein n=1 Tax=Muribaculaceae TaxID=2005473 RepID=UPI00258A533D|nr:MULTISPECIES: hypothetical protein [Muribaculaceae]
MKKIYIILFALVASLQMFASLPIYRDADQIVTMDDKVYMQGKIQILILEISPVSEYAKTYWANIMPHSKSIPSKIAVTYAFSPDWTEYSIVAMLFYNSLGQQIDKIEVEEIVWDKTVSNVRARDMTNIAKGLPRQALK